MEMVIRFLESLANVAKAAAFSCHLSYFV